LKPGQWGSPLVQEKYQEGKAHDRDNNNNNNNIVVVEMYVPYI